VKKVTKYNNKKVIGNCTLYNADCLHLLPKIEFVNAVVSDPPYGTGYVGGYNRKGETIANDDTLEVTAQALKLAQPLCDGNMVVFYSPRISPIFYKKLNFLDWFGQIIWNKKAPGMGGEFRYQHENVALFGKNLPIKKAFSLYSYYRDASEHPHQKPIQIMTQLLNILDANSILDPFMGSGTTGVACAKLGKRFIGIEIDEDHFETAVKRITAAYDQPDLFVENNILQESMELNDAVKT